MLYFDLQKACDNKFITDPRRFLTDVVKLDHAAASRLLYSSVVSVKFSVIEDVCKHLNCTPNDLMSWKPDSDAESARNLELSHLKPLPKKELVVEKLKRLPKDKMEKLKEFLNDLEKE